ncbi:MAG: zinc ABC transporter substrate-binding protein [Oscillospiraceae bacterium]|jgi:zinc transport system substrate-binding protein|nr:zinc ABC transporter substrate-binding protein [Oscillospiraceae bacterium]
MRQFCDKKRSSIWFLVLLILAPCFLFGCVSSADKNESSKLKVVATLFPQYDFAKQILKDKADVRLLLPPGTESHTYDPSPSDIRDICLSDLFLYTGKHMEPWSEKIISGAKSTKVKIADLSQGVTLKKDENHGHDHAKGTSHHHHRCDPHIWLDPTLAIVMVENILKNACEKSPENESFFKENADLLKKELKELDSDFERLISSSKRKQVVFVSRFAHVYFMERYNLGYKTLFSGCFAEAEPSAKALLEITQNIRELGVPAVYFEESSEPAIAKSIAEDTKVKALRFSTCHNLTKDELESGETYLSMMRKNLGNLKVGLDF